MARSKSTLAAQINRTLNSLGNSLPTTTIVDPTHAPNALGFVIPKAPEVPIVQAKPTTESFEDRLNAAVAQADEGVLDGVEINDPFGASTPKQGMGLRWEPAVGVGVDIRPLEMTKGVAAALIHLARNGEAEAVRAFLVDNGAIAHEVPTKKPKASKKGKASKESTKAKRQVANAIERSGLVEPKAAKVEVAPKGITAEDKLNALLNGMAELIKVVAQS